MRIFGLLDCPLLDKGSKSEGLRAVLTDEDGKRYKLYRANTLPISDPFFITYSGRKIGISGENEERTGNFLVHSIILEDGTEIFPEMQNKGNLVSFSANFSTKMPQNTKTGESPKRTPRKVKKKLNKLHLK